MELLKNIEYLSVHEMILNKKSHRGIEFRKISYFNVFFELSQLFRFTLSEVLMDIGIIQFLVILHSRNVIGIGIHEQENQGFLTRQLLVDICVNRLLFYRNFEQTL